MNAAAFHEFDEMRQHRPAGGTEQAGVETDIDAAYDGIDRSVARPDALQDGVAAFLTVRDEGLNEGLRVVDRRAVRRPVQRIVPPSSLWSERR